LDIEDFDDEDSGVEALLKAAGIEEDKKKLAAPEPEDNEDTGTDEPQEGDEQAPEDETEGDDNEAEGDEEETSSKKVVIDPEADAYVTINGKEIKVSELAAVFGKDAELTTRTAEIDTIKQATEDKATKYVAGLEAMLQRATARAEPYAKINFLALSKDPNVSAEELTALHNEAQRAFADVEYLKTSLDGTVNEIHTARHNELVKQGQEAWKALADPEKGIKGWNEDKYKEVSAFAISQGIDKRVIDQLVDPNAIKLLHMAMLYQKGQAAKSVTNKIDKTPKKILKGSQETVTQKARPKPGDKAFQKLKQTGSDDDAVEALLARMAVE